MSCCDAQVHRLVGLVGQQHPHQIHEDHPQFAHRHREGGEGPSPRVLRNLFDVYWNYDEAAASGQTGDYSGCY